MGSEQYKETLAKQFETRSLSILVLETLFSVIAILTIVTGNVLVLLAIYRNTRLRRPANLYIVSLAITDLLVGILPGPFGLSAILTGGWKLGRLGCWFNYVTSYSLPDASILTMFLIAVNRYYKIVKPNKYSNIFSPKFIIASILLAWILALALPFTISSWASAEIDFNAAYVACVPLAKPENIVVIFTTYTLWSLLPFSFISLFYYKIWVFIRQHNAHMNQSEVNLRELKLTKSFFVVIASFTICFTPHIVLAFLDVTFQPRIPRQLCLFSSFMVMIASCVNPVIYGATNQEFRKEFLKIFSTCCAKKGQVEPTCTSMKTRHNHKN